MTLYEIVHGFLDIARKQPNINYVGEGDIYSLNSKPNIDYSVFWVTQTDHSFDEDTITYNLTLFYVDRLLKDESNELMVQSNSMVQLQNIINIFSNMNPDIEIEYNVQVKNFTHRFTDMCAGSYAEITLIVNNDIEICGY